MKTPCEVIRDLLPLYTDDVCSDESRKLVEKHLAECEDCRLELSDMLNGIPANTQKLNLEDAQAVKSLSKKWKRGMLKSLIQGVIIALIVIAMIILLLLTVTDFRIVQGSI